MKTTTETINAVMKTTQPYEAAMWDGLELVTIDTDQNVYNFPNLAISYTIRTNSTIADVSQLIDHKMITLGRVSIASGDNIDQAIASFMIGCECAESVSISKADNMTARQRLAEKMRPAYLALGIVTSTEAGKFLFAMAYDSDCALDYNHKRFAQYEGKRPSKSSQDVRYYEGMSWGQRNSYVTALAAMCADASNGKASRRMCRRVINMEIQAMRSRTAEQMSAAPVTAFCGDVWND